MALNFLANNIYKIYHAETGIFCVFYSLFDILYKCTILYNNNILSIIYIYYIILQY